MNRLLVLAAVAAGCEGGAAAPALDAAPSAFVPPAELRLDDITALSPDLAAHPNYGDIDFSRTDGYAPGVALVDLDGDGVLDLAQPRFDGFDSRRRGVMLYRGLGDGRFAFAGTAGTSGRDYSCVVAFDYDGDDDLDLFLCNFEGASRIARNDGHMRFVDGPALASGARVMSASAGDVDGDGWPDLHVSLFDLRGPDFGAGLAPNSLFHNDGDGSFTDASARAGIACYGRSTLGSVMADLDDDGRVDIYAGTDWHEDCLYRNDGDGTFSEVAAQAGVARGAYNAMGIGVADLDDDLDLDLVVADDHNLDDSVGNAVYLSRGSGAMAFDSVAPALNLDGIYAAGTANALFWGVGLADLDLDGHVDVHFTSSRGTPQLFFLARGGTFVEQRGLMAQLGDLDVRGSAYGDIDGDGDLDVVLARRQAPLQILRNVTAGGGSLTVAPRPLRWAPAARVTIMAGGRARTAVVLAGSSYQSTSPPVAVFGLGGARDVDWIEVRFSDGSTRRVGPARAGDVVTVSR